MSAIYLASHGTIVYFMCCIQIYKQQTLKEYRQYGLCKMYVVMFILSERYLKSVTVYFRTRKNIPELVLYCQFAIEFSSLKLVADKSYK